ncbi:SDR family oxidoreductase [Streptomyces sp. AM2-3-1]|uniref:SDR family oxidoreductase n=1 Tax=Streptomyces sp. AM2-3-1 TaxID=3075824 RepID=UPI0028C509A6|nr:SDR family oxidoreductase [Streptomyces sp. AM2-3-1]WNO62455.1 SDR family oxidoreductase [Streptomyces sp. AM2-3-1]
MAGERIGGVIDVGAGGFDETAGAQGEDGAGREGDLVQVERDAARELTPNDQDRLGRPAEIAATVLYLVGPRSDYVSGSILRVDGGLVTNR